MNKKFIENDQNYLTYVNTKYEDCVFIEQRIFDDEVNKGELQSIILSTRNIPKLLKILINHYEKNEGKE
jgi:hypothetical protein